MGATRLSWTDRHPYTVVEVKSKTCIVVQEDTAIRFDQLGMSDAQSYTYLRNPDAPKTVLRLAKDGKWRQVGHPKGATFALGYRDRYHDFWF